MFLLNSLEGCFSWTTRNKKCDAKTQWYILVYMSRCTQNKCKFKHILGVSNIIVLLLDLVTL